MYVYPSGSSSSWADRGLTAEPVPHGQRRVRDYILEHLRLPIEVPRPEGDWTLTERVVEIWASVVESVQVDDESWAIESNLYESDGFISHLYFEEMDPNSTMYDREGHEDERGFALRIASWYDSARHELSRRLRLMAVPVAGPADFSKHYPDASCRTISDLKARSRARSGGSPVSLLRFGLDQPALEELVHLATAELVAELEAAHDEEVFRGYVDGMVDVGYTNGDATRFLCIEWAPQMAHVYPVSEMEVTGPAISIDNPQGYVRDGP